MRESDKRFYHIVRQPAVTKVTDAVNCMKLSDNHAPASWRTVWIELELPKMKVHLQTLLMAGNFARRLKTLKCLIPFEFTGKAWTNEPDRFRINPVQHTVGLNTQAKLSFFRHLSTRWAE